MNAKSVDGPFTIRQSLKLIISADLVKDQRTARLARQAGARNQDPIAIPTQNALSIQPVTLVQDHFHSDRPDFQPASRTAKIINPIVRSWSGVAQYNVFHWPRVKASTSKSQTSSPPVNHDSSPRLPWISPERNRMSGPTSAKHPASVDRLASKG